MSQTSIGKAALVLTTDGTDAKAGLAKLGTEVQTWSHKIAAAVKGAFHGGGVVSGLQTIGGQLAGHVSGLAGAFKGVLGTAGMAIGTAIGGPIGGAVGAAVGSAVGDLGVTVAGALTAPFEKLNQFEALVKRANSVGIDPSQFQGLTKWLERAGVEAEGVVGVFANLGRVIEDAAAGKAKALAGFQLAGINVADIKGKGLDEQFLIVAEALSKISPGSQQAAAALKIFGDQGAALLPHLQKGRKGIEDFMAEQKRFGATLSDSQLRAAADAALAWKKAKTTIAAAWDGLVNRVTVAVAPMISVIGKGLQKALNFLAPIFDWFGRMWSKIGQIVSAAFEVIEHWVQEAVGWFQGLLSEVFNFGGAWPSIEDVVVFAFRAIGTAVALVWDTFKAGAGIVAIAFGAVIEYGGSTLSLFRRIVDLGRQLPDELRPAGFERFADAVAAADDKVRGWGRGIKEWGINAVQGWGQSAVQFNAWLDRLGEKQKENAKEAKAEAAAAAETVDKLSSKLEHHALLKGTSAEVSARLKNDMGANGKMAQMLAEQKHGNGILGAIRKAADTIAGKNPPALLPM